MEPVLCSDDMQIELLGHTPVVVLVSKGGCDKQKTTQYLKRLSDVILTREGCQGSENRGAKNYFIYFVLLVKKKYKFREIILV